MISSSHLIVPLVSFILFIIFLFKWYSNPSSKALKRLPPSPPKLPLIGNLHQLGLFPHRSLHALSKRYGPLMLLHLGSVPALIVSSADAACEIMKNQDLIFSNRPKLSVIDKVIYGSKDIAFAPYGEYWRQVRSICVLHLLSNKRVQSFRRIREEEMSLMIEKIRHSSSSSINLSNILVTLTNDIISRVALGRKYSDGEAEGSTKFELMLKELAELLGTFNPGDYIPRLNWIKRVTGFEARVEKLARRFDEFFEGVVEEHRNRKKGETNLKDSSHEADLVDILLEAQRENMAVSPIENDTIKAVIFDIFAAGTDTIYTSLEWTMAELLRHPKTMEKLQNEVRQIAGSKLDITEDDLEKLSYLKAVMKESLRLHPPLPLLLPRESTQDSSISGYDIARGTRVLINSWAIGRDPLVWENPNDFQPERFLNTEMDFRGLNFEYIPFGAGRRGCPGITFAIAVDELALAKLILNFDFALPFGLTEKDFDMSEAPGNTITKKFPLVVTISPPS
ncbi:cytochrome P450 71A6-like [Olea europaea var. sylvestris]|uniref:Cytochrome P450 71A6-like n=1 Tax=Olea europaea subsp. europaea TaxID=158383 RepID=A0A8S0R3A0_OLEEU|nr:cytochrome P450 71A6-like [Olea europaea var. sylvestris]XP_022893005.1 cytochrome P450 71A6-like [Olea europaea var. sylvestris]CAA2961478.1 cytochrome P450 71A6-like [Olea europaea subsp. europaea]CAA2973620.1 cytochrome P450 71A6-like [Olea europaea subsp. europaea]